MIDGFSNSSALGAPAELEVVGARRRLPLVAGGIDGKLSARLKLWPDPAQWNVLWKQVLKFYPKQPGEEENFAVRHTATAQFQAGKGITADVPAAQLELRGQNFLGPALLRPPFFDLRADQVELGFSLFPRH